MEGIFFGFWLFHKKPLQHSHHSIVIQLLVETNSCFDNCCVREAQETHCTKWKRKFLNEEEDKALKTLGESKFLGSSGMTSSMTTVLPIGTEKVSPNFKKKLSKTRRRSIAPSRFALFVVVITMLVSSLVTQQLKTAGGKCVLFCSGWKIHSSHLDRTHTARTVLTTSSQTSPMRRQRGVHNFWSPSKINTQNNHCIGFRRASISTVTSTSTTLYMVKAKSTGKWEVGDLVQILPKDGSGEEILQKGEVVSIRGGGWYSIRLLQYGNNGNALETIKCRGTRLERLAFDINDGKAVPNPRSESTTKSSSAASIPSLSWQEEEEVPQIAIETCKENNDDEFVTLPTPEIHDLDALISNNNHWTIGSNNDGVLNSRIEESLLEQVAQHATYENWVVFTDLHCSPSTLDTCLEVLQIVHDTALSHPEKCGVLFLGDFWHHRGTLRVDCLNAVLGAFSNWKVPMIMIPGNHDQVTLGGDNHSLTPLANAYRVETADGGFVSGPLILSNPTIFRKALFVPHIRNADTLRAIVGSSYAKMASALFLHTEVKGAMMNDLIVSTHGISPSVFPSNKHIYSGHFHKPHIVESSENGSRTMIEYLGSPYQVSLAEAHQEKQLVILDANWKCQKRVPISVGKRHFKLSSTEELETIAVQERDEVISATSDNSICVKKGDRIVVTQPAGTLSETDTNAPWISHVKALRKQGLMVEVREAVNSNNKDHTANRNDRKDNGMLGVEELSPESVWRAYLNDAVARDLIHSDDELALLAVGLQILEEIECDESYSSTSSVAAQRELRLTRLSVNGFGPFEETIDYPLDNRGLVLLRGRFFFIFLDLNEYLFLLW